MSPDNVRIVLTHVYFLLVQLVYVFHDTENLHFLGAKHTSATAIFERTLKEAIAAVTDRSTADSTNVVELVVQWDFYLAKTSLPFKSKSTMANRPEPNTGPRITN